MFIVTVVSKSTVSFRIVLADDHGLSTVVEQSRDSNRPVVDKTQERKGTVEGSFQNYLFWRQHVFSKSHSATNSCFFTKNLSCTQQEPRCPNSAMDLNIVIQTDDVRDGDALIVRKLQAAQRLGIKTVALSVRMTLESVDISKVSVPSPPKIEVPSGSNMTILTRLTICLNEGQDSISYKILQQPQVKEYDLLSYEPKATKILDKLCSGSLLCDIISFDMSERMANVDLKRANFNLLRERGVCLEINYTNALKGQTSRQQTINNGQMLVDKSRGRNVILSSGATIPINLRSPYDVSNLALLFGLKEYQAKQSVWKTGLLAMKHSTCRKNPNSSCVVQVEESSVEPQDQWLRQVLLAAEDKNPEIRSSPLQTQKRNRKKRGKDIKDMTQQPPPKMSKQEVKI